MRSLLRSFVRQYWIVLLGIGVVLAAAAFAAHVYGIGPFPASRYLYPDFKRGIENFLAWWCMALIFLGPIPALSHQYSRVRRGERGVMAASARVVAASVVSNLVVYLGMGAMFYFAQKVNLSLFSGDAGFAILALYVYLLAWPGVIALVALVALLIARAARRRQLLDEWKVAVATYSAEAKLPCPFCREKIAASSRACWWCKRALPA